MIKRVVELISNKEDNAKAATILLPKRRTINHPLNLLYPLECGKEKNDTHEDIEIKDTDEPKDGNNNESELNEGKDESIGETQKRRSSR